MYYRQLTLGFGQEKMLKSPVVEIGRGIGRSFIANGHKLNAITKQINSALYYDKRWKIRRARAVGSSALPADVAMSLGRAMDAQVCAMKNPDVNRTLEELDLEFVRAQCPVTNYRNDCVDASVAVVDLVMRERSTGRPVVVEFKNTSLTMKQLTTERYIAHRRRRTGFKPCLLDRAKIQAQLGALFLANTYTLEKRPAAAVIVRCLAGSIYSEWFTDVNETDFGWIKGYRR